MSSRPGSRESRCPACGSALQADFAFCPSCGQTLAKPVRFSDSIEYQDLTELVESANQHLSESGANAAESAFGLGCYLGFIPVALVVIIIYLLGVRNWIILAIVAVGAVLVTTGTASLLAQRARLTNIKTAYLRDVEPEILAYLEQHNLSWEEVDLAASQLLAADAPLMRCLSLKSGETDFVNE